MRVTNQSLTRLVSERLQQAFRRLAKTQEAVTSGKIINRLSDDPLNALRVIDLKGVQESLSQYGKNINVALPFLEGTDSTLAEVEQVLMRAKDLALAMASDSNSSTERTIAATETRQLFLQLLSLANTKVDNRHIFGGFKNGASPFTEGVGVTNYNGDNGEIAIQANASTNVTLNLTGNRVFQGTAMAGGVGLFDVMRDLETLLRGNGLSTLPLSLGLAVNLDSAAVTPGPGFPAGPDAPLSAWQAASNFSTTVTVFDSLGTGHDLTFFFRKSGALTWDYRVVARQSELDAGAPLSTDLREVSSGTLAFTAGGTFDAPGSTINAIGPMAWVNGAASQTIAVPDLQFAGSTQTAAPSAVLTLNQTNTVSFNTQIGRLDAALDQILTLRAEVGARINTANTAKDGLEVAKIQTTALRSRLEDADVLKVYTDFTNLQNAFEAALQSSARMMSLSLLDFLR